VREFEEDSSVQDIEISNTTDWIKFNTISTETSNDPFKITGESLAKVSGLSPTFRR
jgi:hypothetical protein